MKISADEYQRRCAALSDLISEQSLSGVVLFEPAYVLYYSGFAFYPTERPMAFIMNAKGERALFVPRLELEHAKSIAQVDRVDHYPEYPDQSHPMQRLVATLEDLGIQGQTGVDEDGYPRILGYEGPALSEAGEIETFSIKPFIEKQMMIKSEQEITLIRESVRWGHLAHTLLQRYTKPGLSETEVSLRASTEATLAMLDTIGPLYKAQSIESAGAFAGYRGQIGRNAAIPHAMAANIVFQKGDVLVTGAGAPVWGYHSELERTMVLGKPTDDQQRMYDHMLALQNLAIDTIRPRVTCSEVDTVIRSYYEKNELNQHWKHHTGHAIGLRFHEGPFLDIGDPTALEPGMVFTVEPGLYASGVGGFRHSDTVVVREDGIERLTYYARDLASLTLPV